MKIISKTDKILKQLKKEGKVETIDFDYTEFNEEMVRIKREYRYKSAKSEESARNVILI